MGFARPPANLVCRDVREDYEDQRPLVSVYPAVPRLRSVNATVDASWPSAMRPRPCYGPTLPQGRILAVVASSLLPQVTPFACFYLQDNLLTLSQWQVYGQAQAPWIVNMTACFPSRLAR